MASVELSVLDGQKGEFEDIGEGWGSGAEDIVRTTEKDEIEEDQDEVDEEEDDDDDMTSHFRLKEEEAKQMGIKSPWRIVRSRYYIASASHIMSLFNILLHGSSVLNEASHPDVNLTSPQMSMTSMTPPSSKDPSKSPQRTPPFKPIPYVPSTQSIGSAISSVAFPSYSFPSKPPVLVDLDAQMDASAVTDVHYLSHIVFRYEIYYDLIPSSAGFGKSGMSTSAIHNDFVLRFNSHLVS